LKELRYSVHLAEIEVDLTIWENNFSISKLPQHQNLPSQLKAIHRHSDFELFILPGSSLTVHTLDGKLPFRDSIVIIPPSLDHFVTFDNTLCGYYLYFSLKNAPGAKDLRDTDPAQILKQEITSLPLTDDEIFYTQKINDAMKDKARLETLPHLLTLFFFELFSKLLPKPEHASQTQTKYGKYVNTVDLYVSQHYTDTIRLPDLARELYLCPKQVSRILKKAYGCSLSELVNRHRLAAACMLLRYTELEISEIAEQVGYEHENYFYTLFRKAYGTTPGEYRKRDVSKNG